MHRFAFRPWSRVPQQQRQNLGRVPPACASGCTFLVAAFGMRRCFWPGLKGTFQLPTLQVLRIVLLLRLGVNHGDALCGCTWRDVAPGMLIVTGNFSTEKAWKRDGKRETFKDLWC